MLIIPCPIAAIAEFFHLTATENILILQHNLRNHRRFVSFLLFLFHININKVLSSVHTKIRERLAANIKIMSLVQLEKQQFLL